MRHLLLKWLFQVCSDVFVHDSSINTFSTQEWTCIWLIWFLIWLYGVCWEKFECLIIYQILSWQLTNLTVNLVEGICAEYGTHWLSKKAIGCVTLGYDPDEDQWSKITRIIWCINEAMNPFPGWIYQFLLNWCAVIQVILDHWSDLIWIIPRECNQRFETTCKLSSSGGGGGGGWGKAIWGQTLLDMRCWPLRIPTPLLSIVWPVIHPILLVTVRQM